MDDTGEVGVAGPTMRAERAAREIATRFLIGENLGSDAFELDVKVR